jgi:hypothetical protein
MKRIAILILFIFTQVQIVPAIQSLFRESLGYVFNIDEEKTAENREADEKKETKDFAGPFYVIKFQSVKNNVALHLAENISPSPCLEKLTPPPNFC